MDSKTTIIRGLKNFACNHRLAILKQPALQSSHIIANLIYLFKIPNDFVDKDLKQLFFQSSNVSVCDMYLRGNVPKLFVPKPI